VAVSVILSGLGIKPNGDFTRYVPRYSSGKGDKVVVVLVGGVSVGQPVINKKIKILKTKKRDSKTTNFSFFIFFSLRKIKLIINGNAIFL